MAEIKVLENGYVTAAKGYKVATMREIGRAHV